MSDMIDVDSVATILKRHPNESTDFYIKRLGYSPQLRVTHCVDCKYSFVADESEDDDPKYGDTYMCDQWHRLTKDYGYCHLGRPRKNGG